MFLLKDKHFKKRMTLASEVVVVLLLIISCDMKMNIYQGQTNKLSIYLMRLDDNYN